MITSLPRPFVTEDGTIVIALLVSTGAVVHDADRLVYWITNEGTILSSSSAGRILVAQMDEVSA